MGNKVCDSVIIIVFHVSQVNASLARIMNSKRWALLTDFTSGIEAATTTIGRTALAKGPAALSNATCPKTHLQRQLRRLRI